MTKKSKVQTGSFFAIPRSDGRYVLGQVLEKWAKNVLCIAVFNYVFENLQNHALDLTEPPEIISLTSVSKVEISKGYWPIIGCGDVLVDPRLAPHYKFKPPIFLGASWHSGGMIEKLVDAFFNLGTWEPYPGRPGHLRSLLFSSDRSH